MLDLLAQSYNNRRVLITGHTGFKGGWLALILKQLGAEVTGYALQTEEGDSLYKLANLNSEITSIYGDIRDFKNLKKIIAETQPDIVFHLAAQPLVKESYLDPIETYSTNVMGTINLFEAVKIVKNDTAIVNVTTDKCYENKEWVWPYRETDQLGGYDPYSSSKACSEILSSSYQRSFGLNIATARAGNVIGGGDFAKYRIIPDIIKAIKSNKSTLLRNPFSIRPWQHVLDVSAGYLMLGSHLLVGSRDYCTAFNLSPTSCSDLQVKDLTDRFIKYLGRGQYEMQPDPSAHHEAAILKLDSTKAKVMLRWKNNIDIEDAIKLTAEWFNTYLMDKALTNQVTQNQIKKYFNI